MVLSMQKEFLRDKIRINAINPGMVKTELSKSVFENVELDRYQYGLPEDIAVYAGVICSESGRFMRGSCVLIDGLYSRL